MQDPAYSTGSASLLYSAKAHEELLAASQTVMAGVGGGGRGAVTSMEDSRISSHQPGDRSQLIGVGAQFVSQ
ncbi:Fc.00g018250.m01.CDS01 [Cosmosporella sp. VM-42]